jgi:hypothetical protein
MAAMREGVERSRALMTVPPAAKCGGISEFAAPGLLQNGAPSGSRQPVRQGMPAASVMLHLRSCYVSKAAILTIPVRSVPVENRSPT